MRDPNQSMVTQDLLVKQRLERMSVLTYLNQIQRGHKTWADTYPPSRKALLDYRAHLLNNPDCLGHQYANILDALLDANPLLTNLDSKMTRITSLTFQEVLRPDDLNLPG